MAAQGWSAPLIGGVRGARQTWARPLGPTAGRVRAQGGLRPVVRRSGRTPPKGPWGGARAQDGRRARRARPDRGPRATCARPVTGRPGVLLPSATGDPGADIPRRATGYERATVERVPASADGRFPGRTGVGAWCRLPVHGAPDCPATLYRAAARGAAGPTVLSPGGFDGTGRGTAQVRGAGPRSRPGWTNRGGMVTAWARRDCSWKHGGWEPWFRVRENVLPARWVGGLGGGAKYFAGPPAGLLAGSAGGPWGGVPGAAEGPGAGAPADPPR